MAVRYDQKTKDEVVSFIASYNKDNGRGGQTAAAAKYGVTQLTISKWLKSAGLKKGGRKARASAPAPAPVESPAKKKRRGRGPGKAKGGSKATTTSLSGVFQRMIKIREQIDSLQAEFDDLKQKL